MRIRLFLALASLSLVATGFGIEACGGSSTSGDSTTDSGAVETGTDSSVKDAAPVDAADAALPCDPKADFLKNIPDASIADGASTTGVCVSCAKSKCKKEIDSCSADCICQNLAGTAIECYAKTPDLVKCGSPFFSVPTATRNIGIGLFGCLNQECATECATSAFTDGGDGG